MTAPLGPSKPVLRLAFVGLGQGLMRIFQNYPEVKTLPFDIVAGVDVNPDAVAKFTAELGIPGHTSFEDLCADPGVDVLYISTPPELHKEQAIAGLEAGKHVLVEKPMALDLADCEEMVATADRTGYKLMVAHTHSLDLPVLKMAEIVASNTLGELHNIHTWNFNDFNARPFPTSTLRVSHGPLLEQAPHQIDIVRKIARRPATSVTAATFNDSWRGCVGGFTSLIRFGPDVAASVAFDARGFFDTSELFWWVGEGGEARDPETNAKARRHLRRRFAEAGDDPVLRERALEQEKKQDSYNRPALAAGSGRTDNASAAPAKGVKNQPFFGLTIVDCADGAIRQSPNGLRLYREDGVEEIPLEPALRGRAAELMQMYDAVVHGADLVHDGRWGMATLEICFAMLSSSRESREVPLTRQVLTSL
jgi:phthalate 4,5-cis-dihydrodiol dehydrogenase